MKHSSACLCPPCVQSSQETDPMLSISMSQANERRSDSAKSSSEPREMWDFEAMRRIYGLDPRLTASTQDDTSNANSKGTAATPTGRLAPTTPEERSTAIRSMYDEYTKDWAIYKNYVEHYRKWQAQKTIGSAEGEGISTECVWHDWKEYIGFSDIYEYCTICDAKRDKK